MNANTAMKTIDKMELAMNFVNDLKKSLEPNRIVLTCVGNGNVAVYFEDLAKVLFSGTVNQASIFIRGILWGVTINEYRTIKAYLESQEHTNEN